MDNGHTEGISLYANKSSVLDRLACVRYGQPLEHAGCAREKGKMPNGSWKSGKRQWGRQAAAKFLVEACVMC